MKIKMMRKICVFILVITLGGGMSLYLSESEYKDKNIENKALTSKPSIEGFEDELKAVYAQEDQLSNNISAASACLMDVSSGRILFEKNSHKKVQIASTTKVMTALLALEMGELSEKVETSKRAAQVEGSSIYLIEGETLTLEEMLYGLMLESGNDAAHALAEHFSGTVKAFSKEMTKRAKDLGALNTKFANPHGLPAQNQHATAYDITQITRIALKDPVFRKIVSTKQKEIPKGSTEGDVRYLKNDNQLLDQLPYADGVKTGWTEKAGRCLVFSATHENRKVVGAVLNAPNMYEDAEKLIDYGLEAFNDEIIIQEGQILGKFPVASRSNGVWLKAGAEVIYPLRAEEYNRINYITDIPGDVVTRPITIDEHVSDLSVVIDGETLAKVPLLSCEDISGPSFFERFFD